MKSEAGKLLKSEAGKLLKSEARNFWNLDLIFEPPNLESSTGFLECEDEARSSFLDAYCLACENWIVCFKEKNGDRADYQK